MLDIRFIPEPKRPELEIAAKQYQSIWNTEGTAITQKIEETSGLKFKVLKTEAMVFEGISQSEPLKFRASNSQTDKKAVIIHELCHRIVDENYLDGTIKLMQDENPSRAAHKQINLFLFDVWSNLYGKAFANDQIERREKSYASHYAEAWDWALAMTEEERKKILSELKIIDK